MVHALVLYLPTLSRTYFSFRLALIMKFILLFLALCVALTTASFGFRFHRRGGFRFRSRFHNRFFRRNRFGGFGRRVRFHGFRKCKYIRVCMYMSIQLRAHLRKLLCCYDSFSVACFYKCDANEVRWSDNNNNR